MILTPDAYWKIALADRAAYLIDGAAYFRALREAALQARHSVLMVGWDFNSQTQLVPDASTDGLPTRLVPFFDALVRKHKDLHVNLLNWDFAALYAAEREPLPVLRVNWKTDRRFRYAFDSELPFGASHHQKVVVIDDAIAFLGGFDLTVARWDTPEHTPDNPMRTMHDGTAYGPFHDMQMVVTGAAARSLGELCRARWSRATGKELAPPPPVAPIWPASAPVHFREVPVAFSRTFSAYKGWPAVHEVLRLHERLIRDAKRFIYAENEYLTSHDIADLLTARLSDPESPEIVLVVPQVQSGWLEQSTMGVLRARVLKQLRAADKFGRLRVYAPVNGDAVINLHSKTLVVDDEVMKIGSSNLSNRSMGLDSEIDAVIAADGDVSTEQAIACFRATLLGEHLGVAPAEVAEAFRQNDGSLIGTIEALRGGSRTLRELEVETPPLLETIVPDGTLILDPERPMSYGAFVLSMASEIRFPTAKVTLRRVAKLAVLVAVLLLVAVMLNREDISLPALRGWFAANVPAAPWTLLLLGLAAALLFFPVLPVLALIAVLVEPWQALAIGFVTSLTGALSGYLTGRNVRRERVRRLSGQWADRVFPWLEGNRVSDFVLLRLFSGVPYGLANLLSGAARVPLVRYVAASAVALALTSFTIVAFTEVIGLVLSEPDPWRALMLVFMVAVYAAASRLIQQNLGEGEQTSAPPS